MLVAGAPAAQATGPASLIGAAQALPLRRARAGPLRTGEGDSDRRPGVTVTITK